MKKRKIPFAHVQRVFFSLGKETSGALFVKAQEKFLFSSQENGGVLLRDQKYQKSKRGKN